MSLVQEAPPGEPRQSWPTVILVYLVYLALSLWAYWPTLSSLNSALIGTARGDAMRNAWGYWWTRSMLLDHLRWPAWTDMLNYPYGQLILTIDSLNCLLSLPLQILLGFPGGYNAFLICATAFSGLGCYLLTRHLVGSEPAALVAGSAYGLAPLALSAAPAGTSELLNVGWIPIFYLFLYRSLTTGTRRDGILAGIFLACTTMANWYFGYMACLFAIPIILVGLPTRDPGAFWARVRSLEWMLLVFGLFVLGMMLIYGDVTSHVLNAMETGERLRQLLINNSVNLCDLWQPSPQCWHRSSLHHLPWLTLALVGLGILVAPRRAAFPLALGLVAVLLSMSYQKPSASWMTDSLRPMLGLVSRASTALYDLFLGLPFSGMIRFPMRWMVLANLAAAVLVALGLARILAFLPRIPALAAGLILAVAVVGGALESSRYHDILERIPMPRSAYLDLLSEDEEPGAVHHLPERWSVDTQLLEQTIHGRPLVTDLDLVTSKTYRGPDGNPASNLFPALAKMGQAAYNPVLRKWPPRHDKIPEDMYTQTLNSLRNRKVRFLVVHRDLLQPEDRVLFDRHLATHLELIARDGETDLYRVGNPGAGTGTGAAAGR